MQFQKGISLSEFLALYGTEDQCFDALYRWRWPNGFQCPHYGHDRACQLTNRFYLPELIPRLAYVALRTPPMPEKLLKPGVA